MSPQGKDRPGNRRKAASAPDEPTVAQSTGAPLIIAIVLIAAIAIGIGYSLFKGNHEPTGIAMPAGTAMDSAPGQPVGTIGSAAPADSARPEKPVSYGANTLIN
jgi:hypothetical protein